MKLVTVVVILCGLICIKDVIGYAQTQGKKYALKRMRFTDDTCTDPNGCDRPSPQVMQQMRKAVKSQEKMLADYLKKELEKLQKFQKARGLSVAITTPKRSKTTAKSTIQHGKKTTRKSKERNTQTNPNRKTLEATKAKTKEKTSTRTTGKLGAAEKSASFRSEETTTEPKEQSTEIGVKEKPFVAMKTATGTRMSTVETPEKTTMDSANFQHHLSSTKSATMQETALEKNTDTRTQQGTLGNSTSISDAENQSATPDDVKFGFETETSSYLNTNNQKSTAFDNSDFIISTTTKTVEYAETTATSFYAVVKTETTTEDPTTPGQKESMGSTQTEKVGVTENTTEFDEKYLPDSPTAFVSSMTYESTSSASKKKSQATNDTVDEAIQFDADGTTDQNISTVSQENFTTIRRKIEILTDVAETTSARKPILNSPDSSLASFDGTTTHTAVTIPTTLSTFLMQRANFTSTRKMNSTDASDIADATAHSLDLSSTTPDNKTTLTTEHAHLIVSTSQPHTQVYESKLEVTTNVFPYASTAHATANTALTTDKPPTDRKDKVVLNTTTTVKPDRTKPFQYGSTTHTSENTAQAIEKSTFDRQENYVLNISVKPSYESTIPDRTTDWGISKITEILKFKGYDTADRITSAQLSKRYLPNTSIRSTLTQFKDIGEITDFPDRSSQVTTQFSTEKEERNTQSMDLATINETSGLKATTTTARSGIPTSLVTLTGSAIASNIVSKPGSTEIEKSRMPSQNNRVTSAAVTNKSTADTDRERIYQSTPSDTNTSEYKNNISRSQAAMLTATDKPSNLSCGTSEFDKNTWLYDNGLCFNITINTVNHTTAESECQAINGTLASKGIRSRQIINHLKDKMGNTKDLYCWIGLQNKTGTWKWSDGVISTKNNTAWDVDQPEQRNETCAFLINAENTMWKIHDYFCNETLGRYICEKNAA